MITIPIISPEIPPAILKIREYWERNNLDADFAAWAVVPELEQIQLEAIKRFVQAVKDEAQRLYDEDKSRIYEQEFRLAIGHIMRQLTTEEKK